ncbi:anti-sigma factor family protein [Larkinella insperata]|uniref:Anti-sigma factor family protein n=1 Tax=Larkinella insperata TaxID=332158 RepID=A0ABW3QMS3_9BACT
MKLSENQFDLIEAYLNNELSAMDRASFENDIQTDPELSAEVSRQREFRLGLRALGIQKKLEQARSAYKSSLATDHPAPKRAARVQPFFKWQSWAAAASVILVLGVGYYAYEQTASRQADLAFAETVSANTNDDLLKSFPTEGVSSQTRATFLEAINQYKAGKYDRAIEQLKVLPADKKTVAYKNYLLGLSYLANKQSGRAIPLLIKAQQTTSIELHTKAEWFLTLAYVKNNQKERALPLLKRISLNKAHPFQSLAQRVLTKIQ